MQRFHQFLFIAALLALCWLLMMAVHELGHVIGALATGGNVQRVVLHPLGISRTDVFPNPHPSVVVWLGPILGCVIPTIAWRLLPHRMKTTRGMAMYFAGFCLVANGAYIAIGSFDRVGDCGVMLQTGSPLWTLCGFGAITIPLGLYVWHRLGSIRGFLADPTLIGAHTTYLLLISLWIIVVGELVFFTG